MAWVYLAEDLLEERQVAVKVLYPQLSQDGGFIQRFTQEARLAMSLCQAAPDRHIVRVLDYGSDQEVRYLVMEYVPGRDLRHLLEEEGALPWQRALALACQVTQALEHAHHHGVVHRDIKPGNVMVQPDDTVRVLDFGVARARTSPTLTYSGFVGSPHYVAPEQAMGRTVDIRADIYSLGIVLYEMLSGRLPFESDTPWIVINHHIATPPPSLEEVQPGLPELVVRLVHKAMAKRPEDRFQTPGEMAHAAQAILAGQDPAFESNAASASTLEPFLANLYEQAQQATQAEEWSEAVDLFSQILKFDPRYRDVAEELAEAGRQARLAALYAAARRAIKNGRWAEAQAHLGEIIHTVPRYRDVLDLQEQVSRKYELDQFYQQGLQQVEARAWTPAIGLLSRVHDREPNYRRTAELLETARAEKEKRDGPDRHQEPAHTPHGRRLRRRSLAWGIVAVLVVALVVESCLFYRAQQPPAVASVATTTTASVSTRSITTATVALVAVPPTFSPTPTETPSSTARPATTRPATQPARTATATATIQATARPTQASTATETATAAAATSAPAPVISTTPTVTATVTTNRPAPTPAPSGQIAFPRYDPARQTYDVYVCHLDRRGQVQDNACRRVVAQASQPDFLPGGSQLVVHSWLADAKGLAVHSLDGRLVWYITDQIEAARPSVDFVGKHYVYYSRQELDREPRLYRTYEVQYTAFERAGSPVPGHAPAWTPGGQILYSGCLGDDCGILLMNGDGSDPRQVIPGGSETNPEASADGRYIAFMSTKDGNWEVYVAAADGSNVQRITRNPGNDGLPAWSPDGRYLAFVSDRDGSWAVWLVRADGSGLARLFTIGESLAGPVQGAAAHEIHGWLEERLSWAPLP
jgi:outer membrane protein assembly factor BamD (BamD/ComL family)